MLGFVFFVVCIDCMKYIHFGVTQLMTCPQSVDQSHSLTTPSRVIQPQSLPRIQSKTIAAQPCDSPARASIDSGFFVRLASDSFTHRAMRQSFDDATRHSERIPAHT
jgi:hypothetical protein